METNQCLLAYLQTYRIHAYKPLYVCMCVANSSKEIMHTMTPLHV